MTKTTTRRLLKIFMIVSISIATLIAGWFAFAEWATWRTSSKRVEAWLERSTPLGMSYAEVHAFALEVSDKRPRVGGRHPEKHNGLVATSSLTTMVAEYGLLPLPLVAYASATWYFDSDEKLIHIDVESGFDGP